MKELKRKLRSAEDDHKRAQADANKFMSTLKDVFGKVAPLVEKPKKEEEVNGSSSKSEEVKEEVKAE